MKFRKDRQYHRVIPLLRRLVFGSIVFLAFLAIIFSSQPATAQEEDYEEILISLTLPGMSMIELPALIKNDTLYLPVVEIFDFIHVKNTTSNGYDTVAGFFLHQDSTYLIDKPGNRIYFGNSIYDMGSDGLVKTATTLFVKSDHMAKIFGLHPHFNFRALAVTLNTKQELPAIREARLEQMRRNISRLKGDIKADSVYPRVYSPFHFGMADWSVISTQQEGSPVDTRIGLSFGTVLAGGETNVALNYSTSQDFNAKQQYYLWRRVNNENKHLRQLMAGKIPLNTISSIFSPVIGVQATNAQTTVRRSFGSYRLTDVTNPGWIVELYVNNTLVDYTKADATGMFSFDVPLIYGSSVIKLRYYGPFGEESFKEENVNIPYNFLPEKQFEYNVSAGILEDKRKFSLDSNGRFGRFAGTYGLSKSITMTGGLEYLSTVTASPAMPFLQTSARITPNLLFFGEYTHDVRTKGSLLYRTVKNWQFEATYTKFRKGQTAINNNSIDERRLVFSVPIRMRKFSLFSMMTLNQSILPNTSFTTAEWTLNGLAFGFDARLSTYGYFIKEGQPLIYSNISTVLRLPGAFLLTPEAQYSYTAKDFISAKALLEKRIFRYGYMGLAFERNFKTDIQNASIQLRYDIPYAQLGATARYFNNKFSFIEVARGSLQFDQRSNFVNATNSVSIGRGGLAIMPFLDLNCNNVRDADEPKVSGLKFRIGSGRILPENKDTVIHVTDLEAYSTHYIELNRFSFDNIAWQIQKKVLRVTIEPNNFKSIEVPIAVVAEVTGTVSILKNRTIKGQGQIFVNFYKNDSLVARTLSESDGYFSYMGLAPGSYTASIDSAQMQRVNMKSSAPVPFTVQINREGDIIDGLEFTVQSLIPDTSRSVKMDTVVTPELKTGKTQTNIQPIKKKTVKSSVIKKTVKPSNTSLRPRSPAQKTTPTKQQIQRKPATKPTKSSQKPKQKVSGQPAVKPMAPPKKTVDRQKQRVPVPKVSPRVDTLKTALGIDTNKLVDSALVRKPGKDSIVVDSIKTTETAVIDSTKTKNAIDTSRMQPGEMGENEADSATTGQIDKLKNSQTGEADKRKKRRFLGLFKF